MFSSDFEEITSELRLQRMLSDERIGALRTQAESPYPV